MVKSIDGTSPSPFKENTVGFIFKTLGGMVRAVRFVQPENTTCPISETFPGIMIEDSLLQSAKVQSLISVMLSGMVRDVRLVQS